MSMDALQAALSAIDSAMALPPPYPDVGQSDLNSPLAYYERALAAAITSQGGDALLVQARYSIDGVDWHSLCGSGDIFFALSTNAGVTWSEAIRFGITTGVNGWTKKKTINIEALIIGAEVNVNSSGPSTTVSGDTINLGSSADLFNRNPMMLITLNSVVLDRGTEVVWVSSTSFRVELAMDPPDIIRILV